MRSVTQLFSLSVGRGAGSWRVEKQLKGHSLSSTRRDSLGESRLTSFTEGGPSICHSAQTNRPTQKTNSFRVSGEKEAIPCIWNSETKPLRDFKVFYEKQEKQRARPERYTLVPPCPGSSSSLLTLSHVQTQLSLELSRRISSEEPKETGDGERPGLPCRVGGRQGT